MEDDLISRVKNDFARARLKAFLNRVRNALVGRPDALLSYDEVKEKLRIGGPVYRGVKTIPVNKIVGSLDRYQEFDRAFLPLKDQSAARWENIDRAFYRDVSLPPILLYKVGDVYFVVDGHHRVSVAHQRGQEYIDAEVRECVTKVNITPDIRPEDLEIIGQKVDFLERTGLDRIRPQARIKLTILGGFERLLEHIAVHKYFMGLDLKRDISDEEAVADWYDTVYLPIVRIIRKSNILREFWGRTEADLYLWALDRQRYLSQEGRDLVPPEKAAEEFIDEV